MLNAIVFYNYGIIKLEKFHFTAQEELENVSILFNA